MADLLSPQWESCKVCGGDHWTKDHPEAHHIGRDQIEAIGWTCTVCGESVGFIDGLPYHDDPSLNPDGENPELIR